jgi:hypothetical protein
MSTPILQDYKYDNIEQVKTQSGGKIVRKVSIKNGKGYKSISRYHKRKHAGTIKKNLKTAEIQMIKLGKFIPGLFNDCKSCSKRMNNKTRKQKRK